MPVVILSGVAAEGEAVRRAYDLGALDCLVKPVSLDRLLSVARVATEVRRLRRRCGELEREVEKLRGRPAGEGPLLLQEPSAPAGRIARKG